MSRLLRGLRGSTLGVVAALLALLVIAGCSSGGSDGGGSSAGQSEAGADSDIAAGSAGEGGDAPESSEPVGADPARPALLTDRAQIKTGSISLRDEDVSAVVDEITTLVASRRGEIASETTSTDRDGKAQRSVLELRVPVADFDTTVLAIAGLATLVDKTTDSQDVTTEVADVDSRVESARDSLQSLRRLFVRATRLGQIIALETQVAQRQADLESLLAQQQVLADQTSLSTITVTVTQPPREQVEPTKEDQDQQGFMSGISQGWDAFVTFVVGLGHAVGVALPLGSLFLLIGLAGWTVVRRRLPRPHPEPAD